MATIPGVPGTTARPRPDRPGAPRRSQRDRRRRGPMGRAARRLSTMRDATPLTYFALIFTALLSAFPIYWMFVVATRGNDVIAMRPPPIFPGANFVENTGRLFANPEANFTLGLINSLVAATVVAFSMILFCSLAGFALAKLPFRGRNAVLVLIILTMSVPVQMGLIPMYIVMNQLGWVNQLQAIIVPFMVTGFGVFMMRQYALQAIPDELIEAARVDGCSTFRIYWSVVLPALRPAMVVLALLSFMQSWNDFIWPLAVLTAENPTVQMSIRQLANAYFNDYALMFTGATFATVPLIIVFIIFGRQLIGGIMEGAIKA